MPGLSSMFKILFITCLLATCFTIVPAAKNTARINNPSNVGDGNTIPPVSIEGLLSWIVEQYGSQATQWIGLKFLSAIFGGDSDSEKILQEINQVLQNQKVIISDLNEIIALVKWEGDYVNGVQAEISIANWYNELTALSNITNPETRNNTAQRLAGGILDPDIGILLQLEKLNSVLTNNSTLGPNDQGMITYWGQQNYVLMLNASSSFSHWGLYNAVTSYMAAVAHLQVMGIALYCNAIMDDGACNYQLKRLHDNIAYQNELSKRSVPASTFYLVSDEFQNQWQIAYGTGSYASYCIYGVPTTGAVYARPRHNLNWDEEWMFAAVGEQTGNYNMMVRHYYAAHYKMGWQGSYYIINADSKHGVANIKIVPTWGTPTQVRLYDTQRKTYVTLNVNSNLEEVDAYPTISDFSLSGQNLIEPPTVTPTTKPTTTPTVAPTVAPPTVTPTECPDKKKKDVSVNININVDVNAKK